MKEPKIIGYVGVDSGQVIITDPCYIDSEWEVTNDESVLGVNKKDKGKYNYRGCAYATLTSPNSGGQLNFSKGHAGAGVASSTGWGDGLYPVTAYYDKDDRVKELRIKFN